MFAAFLLLASGNARAQTSVATDRAALVALYEATDGANWADNTNWLSTEGLSAWYGVTTDGNGRVTELDLDDNRLSGAIPAALGNLTNLQNLDLCGNQLGGAIPAALGNLTNLLTLSLYDNQLSGTIPAALGNLANLAILHLWNNQLSGEIPAALGDLANLRTLDLWRNQLSGEIPAALGTLTRLQELYLNSNPQLTGTIPPALENLAQLRAFYVHGTGVCVPPGSDLQAWLEPIDFRGSVCGAPLQFSATSTTREVPENSDPGTDVGAPVTATDANGNMLTYTLGGPDAESFTIVSTTGQIRTKSGVTYDHETQSAYSVTVTADDGTATATISVMITVTPDPPGPPPPPPGGGGGGRPRTSAPGAPRNLTVVGGNGEVVLTWDAPASDGGAAITDYEYRINERNPWISIGSTDTTHTVTGLVNGTEYTFQVRAVNRIGKGRVPNQAEATPEAPEVFTLDFAHFVNGASITSDLVFVNVSTQRSRPAIYFYDTEGVPIAAESVVDITGDLEVQEDGGLTVLTEMDPLGELTISTHGRGALVSGSVKVVSYTPIGGMLRFDLPAIGEAVVGASPPLSDALFAVRRQEGGITTGVAIHNLEEEPMEVVCGLMQEGVLRDAVSLPLEANGQTAWLIDQAFPAADTSDFVGSVRCDAPAMFSAVALEMDPGTRVFTTLPVVPLEER